MGLSRAEEVWSLLPTQDHLAAGARYAAITLPWTFNRMMLNTESGGQRRRALNISKGIVGQEVLREALVERGKQAVLQRKSHRDEDLFDLHVEIDGDLRKYDLKTLNYYSDYAGVDRPPFSPQLVVDNAAYAGPDWRRFFPMLVPHTQIRQHKEGYCFAIASSIDFRRDPATDRSMYWLAAFPYGEWLPFLAAKRLCLARESAGKGFRIGCSYHTEALLNHGEAKLTVYGEWSGQACEEEATLSPNGGVDEVGPFSCISSFRVTQRDYERLYGRIEISVARNDLGERVLNSTRRNVNTVPESSFVLTREDFCNLVLPQSYTVNFIGWISKEEFLLRCRQYTGWVWPRDSKSRYDNQQWSQITERDHTKLARAGFEDCVQKKPPLLNAGWMKASGSGGGACCYVYPNIGRGGGVHETNLYVLPQDLHPMDELAKV